MSPSVEIITSDSPEVPVVTRISDLISRARRSSGGQPIDEHRWSQWAYNSNQTIVVVGDEIPSAFALITPTGNEWNVDLVVAPESSCDRNVTAQAVSGAVSAVSAAGGGLTQMWVHQANDVHARAAVDVGLTERRDVHQLRVPLPVSAPDVDPIETRPFVVGADEAAWLAVNAAAFADHADQGAWTVDELVEREAEPWFDTEGFLLHEIDGRLAGFNWTKVHDAERLGEIYVIGVHPDFAGRGLGKRLCVAGLEHLAEQVPTGMLYVDADNAPAMGLYLGLGFTIDHTNTAFAGRIS